MHIKEFYPDIKQPNKLYVSIVLDKIKIEDSVLTLRPDNTSSVNVRLSSTISVPQLLSKINTNYARFLKYIPDELLSLEQNQTKAKELEAEKILAAIGVNPSEASNLLNLARDTLTQNSSIVNNNMQTSENNSLSEVAKDLPVTEFTAEEQAYLGKENSTQKLSLSDNDFEFTNSDRLESERLKAMSRKR